MSLFACCLNTFRQNIRPFATPLRSPQWQAIRCKGQLAPKRTKYRKAHKGRVPVKIGGSTKGTTVEYGDYGLRVLEGIRLSAKQLSTTEEAVKKGLKVVKGAKQYLRVFPDIPVCIKGNETRMGKGKGTFEYWAVRVPSGKIVIEIGGPGLRPEIAQSILRIAAHKMPVKTEFVARGDLGKLGELDVPRGASGTSVLSEVRLDQADSRSPPSPSPPSMPS